MWFLSVDGTVQVLAKHYGLGEYFLIIYFGHQNFILGYMILIKS